MRIEPYLFFDGRCEEAVEFYRHALDAEVVDLIRFKDSPEPPTADCPHPAGGGDKVMHTTLRIGDTTVMASDGQCGGNPEFRGFALSIAARDAADAERRFSALADGGQVQMPLGPTFFAASFGMVSDRFGVAWMVIAGK